MTEAIMAAAITAGASIICQMMIGRRTREQAAKAQEENSKLVLYRLEELEKKVLKHNNLVERMYKLEERTKSNMHRLDDLERGDGK